MSAPTSQDEAGGRWPRFHFRIRTLAVLVACCAPVFWAAREIRERTAEKTPARAMRMLQSDDPGVRYQGLSDLAFLLNLDSLNARQVDEAIPPLIVALEDPEALVRELAMESLLAIVYDGGHRTGVLPRVEEIVSAVPGSLRDAAPGVHRSGVLILRYIYVDYAHVWAVKPPLPKDADRFAEELGRVMMGRDGETPGWAYQVLWATAPRLDRPPAHLLAALHSRYPEVRDRAIRTVARLPRGIDEALPKLLRILESDEDPGIRSTCSRALAGTRPSSAAMPLLVEALRSRSRSLRYTAADLLGRIGPKAGRAVPAIVPLLDEPAESDADDPAAAAAEALGAIAPGTDMAPIAEEALGRFLGRSPPAWRRADAEAALQRIRSRIGAAR